MRKTMQFKAAQVFSRFVKDVFIVLAGTAVSFGFVHVITMQALRHFQGSIDLDRFYRVFITYQMAPVAAVFAVLTGVIYHQYRKTKKIMIALQEKEVAAQREEAMVKTLQKITAVMSSSIARYNGDILHWAALKRKAGHQPPGRVVEASMKISRTLDALSRLSYIMPYRMEGAAGLDEYLDILDKRLQAVAADRQMLIGEHNER